MTARAHAVAGCAQPGALVLGRSRGKKLRRRRAQAGGAGKGLAVAVVLTLLLVIGVPPLVANGVRSTWHRPSHPTTAIVDGGIEYQVVQVQPGDTLWSLARRYGSPGRGMAERVALLQAMNGLEGSFLRVGMELKVPAVDEGSLLVAGDGAPAAAAAKERP